MKPAILVHYISHFTHSEYSLQELKPEAILASILRQSSTRIVFFKVFFQERATCFTTERTTGQPAATFVTTLVYKFTTYFT